MRTRSALLLLVLLVIIAAASYITVFPTSPSMAITQIYGEKLQAGDTVDMNISLVGTWDTTSWAADIAWDPYVLQVQTGDPNGWTDDISRIKYSIFRGPFLQSAANGTMFTINTVDNQAGTITRISEGIKDPGFTASGSGVVLTIRFVCVHPGITTVEITGPNTKVAGHSYIQNSVGNDISHQDLDGIVTDGPPPPIWTEFWVQATAIGIEIVVLGAILSVMYRKRHPRSRPVPGSELSEEIKL